MFLAVLRTSNTQGADPARGAALRRGYNVYSRTAVYSYVYKFITVNYNYVLCKFIAGIRTGRVTDVRLMHVRSKPSNPVITVAFIVAAPH